MFVCNTNCTVDYNDNVTFMTPGSPDNAFSSRLDDLCASAFIFSLLALVCIIAAIIFVYVAPRCKSNWIIYNYNGCVISLYIIVRGWNQSSTETRWGNNEHQPLKWSMESLKNQATDSRVVYVNCLSFIITCFTSNNQETTHLDMDVLINYKLKMVMENIVLQEQMKEILKKL